MKSDVAVISTNDPLFDASQALPESSAWRHTPLLLRPSPSSSMVVRGVRYSTSAEYSQDVDVNTPLPINDGTERDGRCLVIDFHTDLFEGTALFRIKLRKDENPPPTTDECKYYFTGRKRTFQAVIKGRFRQPIPVSACATGQVFDRPPSKLPPKFVLHGAVSLFKKLSPQLILDFDGKTPKFLSPLASAAQTVKADDITDSGETTRPPNTSNSIELPMTEPDPADPRSLHQCLLRSGNNQSLPKSSGTTQSRMKARKKAFDRNFSRKEQEPRFDPNKEYSFEFFQHLLHFEDFSLDLGIGGRHKLAGVLNNQPLKCMAARYRLDRSGYDDLDYLWAFDIWHKSLQT